MNTMNGQTASQSTLGRVAQINVSPNGGVPKLPIESTIIHLDRVEGDKQNNRKYHGGPQRAICLYSLEIIEQLQSEGHPIEAGASGENITLSGVDWNAIQPGVRLHIGSEVVLEVASFTKPCFKIKAYFHDEDFTRIWQRHHPGWSRVYAKVLCPGTVQRGDEVRLGNAES
jgi:MOSC domain-containing protein YiiM